MYLNMLILIFGLVWSIVSTATPTVEILQSCKKMRPANKNIVMTELNAAGYRKTDEPNCRNQFDNIINDQIYGWITCNGKPYFIINNKKIPFVSANNLSINPVIKPETPLIQTTMWWKITSQDTSYLCIVSPLTDTGQGANSLQYYLIEDPFNAERETYPVYFYFFDKDISKIF